MVGNILTRSDDSEIFQYDFEDFPAYAHTGVLSKWVNLTASPHWHEDLEFIVVEKGSMIYYVNGQAVSLRQGQMILVNSHMLHGFSSQDPDCTYLCTLLHPMLLCVSRQIEQAFVTPVINGGIPYLFLDGGKEWHRQVMDGFREIHNCMGTTTAPLKIQSLFYSIWLELFKRVFREQIRNAPVRQKGEQGLTALKSMMLFIQRNYKGKVSLGEIAQAGAVCKSTCLSLFKKYLRDTPVNYLISYRLKKAAGLLLSSDISVTDTAYESGFTNISYFIETFHRVYGKSPLEYRKSRTLTEREDFN